MKKVVLSILITANILGQESVEKPAKTPTNALIALKKPKNIKSLETKISQFEKDKFILDAIKKAQRTNRLAIAGAAIASGLTVYFALNPEKVPQVIAKTGAGLNQLAATIENYHTEKNEKTTPKE
jgi:hypothetical protein